MSTYYFHGMQSPKTERTPIASIQVFIVPGAEAKHPRFTACLDIGTGIHRLHRPLTLEYDTASDAAESARLLLSEILDGTEDDD